MRLDFTLTSTGLAQSLLGLHWSTFAVLAAAGAAAAYNAFPAPGAPLWALVALCALWQGAVLSVALFDRLRPVLAFAPVSRGRMALRATSGAIPLHRKDQP